MLLVFEAPVSHHREHGHKRQSVRCEGIFDALRPPPERHTSNDLFPLKVAELVGENFSAGFGDLPKQLPEAQRAELQRVDDHRLPFSVDHVRGSSNRAVEQFHRISLEKSLPITVLGGNDGVRTHR